MRSSVQEVYHKLQNADTDNIFTWQVDYLEEGKFRILALVDIDDGQYASAYVVDDHSESYVKFDKSIQDVYEHFLEKYRKMVDKPPMIKYN